MTVKELFSISSGVIFIVGFIPYIRAIWKTRHLPSGYPCKVEPSKASWIIWASLDTITLGAMLIARTVNGQIIGVAAGAWIVTGIVMKFGKTAWSRLDKFCLAGAIIGILLGFVFSSPLLAMCASMSTSMIGSIPTFVSAYRDPSKEDRAAWTIFWISCVVALFAIPRWTFMDTAQVLTFTAVETVMMALLWIRPRFAKIPSASIASEIKT